jgi:hypothetical protein
MAISDMQWSLPSGLLWHWKVLQRSETGNCDLCHQDCVQRMQPI